MNRLRARIDAELDGLGGLVAGARRLAPANTSSGPVTSRLCTPSNRTITTVRMHVSVPPATECQQ